MAGGRQTAIHSLWRFLSPFRTRQERVVLARSESLPGEQVLKITVTETTVIEAAAAGVGADLRMLVEVQLTRVHDLPVK